MLSGYQPAKTTVTVNGRKFIRLSAAGFGNAGSANAVCSQIKIQGGACFVRNASGGTPVRMASNSGRRIASR
jgi:D-alanyl-D-alanine carboxypeptidase